MSTLEPPKDLAKGLGALRPKRKTPTSARILASWVLQAEQAMGAPGNGGRLSWLVASTVVIAALQRALDQGGTSRFLLKGGTLLQHRLHLAARATRDVDGLVRGDIESFLGTLDESLGLNWGPLTLRRSEIEVIPVPTKVVKPRRFSVTLSLQGVTRRKIQVEISPDEGAAGESYETITPPPLDRLGLPNPDQLLGIALQYQIAQKVHAATDPHDPPLVVNDRARDVVDLLLLRDLAVAEGSPSRSKIRAAILDIFASRAAEATELGRAPREWPTRLTALEHWHSDFESAADSAGLSHDLEDAIGQVNAWLDSIDCL